VFVSGRVFKYLKPDAAAIVCGAMAAGGIALSSLGLSTPLFILGYGILFGTANGIAYSLFLAVAAREMPEAVGWATGIVTAAYSVGAALFAQVLAALIMLFSVWVALAALAFAILAFSTLAAWLFRFGGNTSLSLKPVPQPAVRDWSFIIWIWFVYLLGVAGGLMVIAHASALQAAAIGSTWEVQLAPTLVALGNIVGSLGGGRLVEKLGIRLALFFPLAVSGLAILTLLAVPALTQPALLLCGMCYGAIVAAVPVAVRAAQGSDNFSRSFGYVFTAWGLAGLCAPSAAGLLFDVAGSYWLSVGIAAAAALSAAALALVGRQGELKPT
jgi:hypothetical protein